MKPSSSISPLSPMTKTRHTYDRVEKAVTFYKLTSNWSGFLFCMIACKKIEIPTAPKIDVRRVCRDTSLNPAMVGRILIPACTSPPVEDHWCRFTPPARSDKGGSERRQSRFHRWLRRGMNPPSSLSRRCLVYFQWRRRDIHPHTRTNGRVEKAALCGGWGWREERRVGEGDDFRCWRSRCGSRQKSDGARADDTYETVTYGVRSVPIADEWMRKCTENGHGNIGCSHRLRVQNAVRPWHLAPRSRPGRSSR